MNWFKRESTATVAERDPQHGEELLIDSINDFVHALHPPTRKDAENLRRTMFNLVASIVGEAKAAARR